MLDFNLVLLADRQIFAGPRGRTGCARQTAESWRMVPGRSMGGKTFDRIDMVAMISDTGYLQAIMRPVHDLITVNFTRLEKVQNKSNRYFWKCSHCGDAEGLRGAQIQGRDNNLPNHLKDCLKVPQEARKDARIFLSNKVLAPLKYCHRWVI